MDMFIIGVGVFVIIMSSVLYALRVSHLWIAVLLMGVSFMCAGATYYPASFAACIGALILVIFHFIVSDYNYKELKI